MLSKTIFILTSAAVLVNGQFDPKSVPYATRGQAMLYRRPLYTKREHHTDISLYPQRPGAAPKHPPVPFSVYSYLVPPAHRQQTPAKLSQDDLSYNCLCSNGVSPNSTEFSQTIPYYTCTETNNQCVADCDGNLVCQNNCRVENPCGAQAPKRVNVTTTTTATKAATATATETPVNTLINGANSAAPRLASVDMNHVYGLCVLVGGFVAGFATLL
ncbi:hypothetical protein N7457_005968 [Penicillium paradoxum]|uniref:uncharacterized protein n=1 Tax=Penicillium paradoxum TaxID=176176 RepID=UPI0025481A4B|nr:uncharacterized protein N7457_005968 [Penicillium paradoxum]KAJ5780808.1 hypothetical protein N7457_005968 [Penicillium paradoxum]